MQRPMKSRKTKFYAFYFLLHFWSLACWLAAQRIFANQENLFASSRKGFNFLGHFMTESLERQFWTMMLTRQWNFQPSYSKNLFLSQVNLWRTVLMRTKITMDSMFNHKTPHGISKGVFDTIIVVSISD